MKVAAPPAPRRTSGEASFRSLEAAFLKARGPRAIDDLVKGFTTKPVVLIAGDQLTGKSTAAKGLATELGGEASGTGALVRAAAARAGKPTEEFVKTLPPSFDIELDYEAAKKIGAGDAAVFESRLAGHLGQMLRRLGRKNAFSVYLTASPRERALRYLNRELSHEVRARVEPKLDIGKGATLEQALAAIVALGDEDAARLAGSLNDIAARDEVDRARLKRLYGLDYREPSAFDIVISTDGKTPQAVQREILSAVRARLGR